MSKQPQAPPRQNFLQMMLLFGVVFLATQLMCNPNRGPQDPRTSQQILGDVNNPISGEPPPVKVGETREKTKGTMAWANSTLNWYTLSQIKSLYDNKVDAELKGAEKDLKDDAKRKDLEAAADQQKLHGDILLADAQYKYAKAHNDVNVMRQAFNTIQGWERRIQGKPLWDQTFAVPAADAQPERFAWREWSTHALYQSLVDDISARNKTDLVYGIFPGYRIIDSLVHLTGAVPAFSYAFAAFLLALLVRAVIFPLAQRQLMWGRKMQQLAPLVKEIREQYTDKKTKQVDQAAVQQKTMALYQEYGINPLAGCLPAFIQFPLFITVYQFMLHYQFAFRSGTFLWINPSTSAATNGFFAPNLGERDYVLIVLYGITMVISTLLMPVSDPTQVKQQRLMGVGMGLLFTFMMFTGAFPTPAAFVLYWVFTNILATLQSLRAYRMPLPPLEKVNTKPGGVFPMPPFSDPKANGKTNGTTNGKYGQVQTSKSTGAPAKHKPKKRN